MKLYRDDRLSMMNKKFPPPFDAGHMVWQPNWIEGKILNNVCSGTAASFNVNLHIDDDAEMWNVSFKFQSDQPHGLAAVLD